MYNLWLAFNGTAQPLPGACGARCVSIWYLEGGVQTDRRPRPRLRVLGDGEREDPGARLRRRRDRDPRRETSPAPDQYTQVLDAARLAACQPHVGAYFNFLLFDEPVLTGWQSGAYWADRTPKDSLPAFRQVIAEINAGAVDCNALKGGPPSPDFMPPTAPTNVAGTASRDPLRVELSWTASTDDASAISYRVYRNGTHVGTTAATSLDEHRGRAGHDVHVHRSRSRRGRESRRRVLGGGRHDPVGDRRPDLLRRGGRVRSARMRPLRTPARRRPSGSTGAARARRTRI